MVSLAIAHDETVSTLRRKEKMNGMEFHKKKKKLSVRRNYFLLVKFAMPWGLRLRYYTLKVDSVLKGRKEERFGSFGLANWTDGYQGCKNASHVTG